MPFASHALRPGLTSSPPSSDDELHFIDITRRQLEILNWIQAGKSASDIGGILGISGRTVEGHILKLRDRLGVRTRLQAVLRARDLGLLGDDASTYPLPEGRLACRVEPRGGAK